MLGEEDEYAVRSRARAGGPDASEYGARPRRPPVEDSRPLPSLHAVLRGEVKALLPVGAIVDLGAWHSGLVHLTQLSSSKVEDPAEVCARGDSVWVKVIQVDEHAQRVSLSLKIVSQTDGTDRDPMHLEAEKLQRSRQRAAQRGAGDEGGADGPGRGTSGGGRHHHGSRAGHGVREVRGQRTSGL